MKPKKDHKGPTPSWEWTRLGWTKLEWIRLGWVTSRKPIGAQPIMPQGCLQGAHGAQPTRAQRHPLGPKGWIGLGWTKLGLTRLDWAAQ